MNTAPTPSVIVRHIRTKDHRPDRRVRWGTGGMINANAPTLCGAPGTVDDTDRKTHAHCMKTPHVPCFKRALEETCLACAEVALMGVPAAKTVTV